MGQMLELFDGYSMGFLSGFSPDGLNSVLGGQGVTIVVNEGFRRRVFLDTDRCQDQEKILEKQRRAPRPVSREKFLQILREADYGYGLYADRIGSY